MLTQRDENRHYYRLPTLTKTFCAQIAKCFDQSLFGPPLKIENHRLPNALIKFRTEHVLVFVWAVPQNPKDCQMLDQTEHVVLFVGAAPQNRKPTHHVNHCHLPHWLKSKNQVVLLSYHIDRKVDRLDG